MRLHFFILSFLLFACTGKNTDSDVTNKEQPQAILNSKKFSLKDLQFTDLAGNSFSGEELLGKPVFINFWATWCGPCVREMPSIEAAKKQIPEIIFIFPSDEGLKNLKAFKSNRKFELNFVQINSDMGKLNIYSLPTTFLIDKDGQLIETVIGARDWSSPESIAQLKKLVHI